MDASETAGFEPTLEAIDMARAKRLDACNRLAGLREVGEEPRDGDGIGLHRRTRRQRTGRRGKMAKRPSHSQSETTRPQRSEVDERLAAVLRGDREAQPGDRVGIWQNGVAVFTAESDLTPFAGTRHSLARLRDEGQEFFDRGVDRVGAAGDMIEVDIGRR